MKILSSIFVVAALLFLTALYADAQTVVRMKMAGQARERIKVVALFDEEIPESVPVVLGVMGYSVTGGVTPYKFEWLQNGKVISTGDVAVVTPSRGDRLDLNVTDATGCSATTSFNLKVASRQVFDQQQDDGSIRVYPTLIEDVVNVMVDDDKESALVRFFCLNGQTHLSQTISGSSTISVNLPAGVYFVSVQTAQKHIVKKVVKR